MDMFQVTHREMMAELEREIALRRKVYPRWVQQGKMKPERAERGIQVLEVLAAELAIEWRGDV